MLIFLYKVLRWQHNAHQKDKTKSQNGSVNRVNNVKRGADF